MKAIFFNNDSKSSEDIQEVKDQVFNLVMNGKPFTFVQYDGDGDIYTNHYDIVTKEFEKVEIIDL
jgi:hypothetical protein